MSSFLLSVDQDRVSVAPASSIEFLVRVQNLTTLLDQVTLRVEGVDPEWVQVVPPVVPVFAQGTASARVIVSPPGVVSRSPAGVYGVNVVGVSQEHAGEQASAALTLEVQLVGDYQLKLAAAQPGSAPQEMRFPVRVQNNSNSVLQLRLGGTDRGDALWYKFEPFALSVPGGTEASALLTARVKAMSSGQRSIPFVVSGSGDFLLRDNSPVPAPAREIAAQFVQGGLAALMVSLSPQQSAATRMTTVQVRVGNPGTIPVSVAMAAASDSDALSFQVIPAQLTLGPQAEQRASLTIRAMSSLEPGSVARVFSYRVSATAADGLALPGSTEGNFQQLAEAKPFPWALVIGIGILLLLVFFGIILLVIGTVGR